MEIAVSLDVLKGIADKCEMCNEQSLISSLYRLVHCSVDSTWICSFRHLKPQTTTESQYDNADNVLFGDGLDFEFSANFLQPCGFVISNPPDEFQPKYINDKVPENLKMLECFYVFVFCYSKGGVASLNESLSCYRATWQDEKLKTELIPYESIIWVENHFKELSRLGLDLLGCSHLVQVPLSLNEGVELDAQILGLKKLHEIKPLLSESIETVLSKRWYCLPSFSIPEDLEIIMTLEDIPVVKTQVDANQLHLLGFNYNSGCVKHVFITEDVSTLSPDVMFQVLVQQLICIESASLQGDVTEETIGYILGCVHANGLKLLEFLKRNDKLVTLVSAAEYKQTPIVECKAKPKGSKSTKGSAKKSTPKKEVVKINHTETIVSRVNIELLNNGGAVSCSVELNKQSGRLELKLLQPAATPELLKNVCVSVVVKLVLNCNATNVLLPFGGHSVLPFGVLSGRLPSWLGSVAKRNLPGQGLEFVVNPLDLADDKMLQSPHLKGPLSPPWMSNKTSTTYLVSGTYLYYHYNQCGINDTGWGCCYRSLQLVCSWYLLNFYTLRRVPNHAQIQKVLKENDPSHANLTIGSNKWIGTVECGYFINWYLGFNIRILYLNQVSDFKNYNGIIAEHFSKHSTPIIIGAGLYAYVLLGICLGQQAEAAYLIADPHYVGEDSIKSIQDKGAVAWKKIDFLAKAASNTFINLCCPQLDKYTS